MGPRVRAQTALSQDWGNAALSTALVPPGHVGQQDTKAPSAARKPRLHEARNVPWNTNTPSTRKARFTMSSIQSKTTRHAKKQENVTHSEEKNHLRPIQKIAQIIQLATNSWGQQ